MVLKKLLLIVLFIILQLSISALSIPRPRTIDARNEDGIIDWTVAKVSLNIDGCVQDNATRNVIVVYPTYIGNQPFVDTGKPFPFPAPTLIVRPNQRVRVLIRNNLGEPTTVHWHGLLMQKTCFSDGVPTITQCPIKSGDNFLYEFRANAKPGTHWYHSHYKPQRVDGFYGYIIIKDADKSYVDLADDDENAEDPCPYCVLISDWYHAWANTLLNAYHYCNDSPKTTVEPVPHSIVINGKGAGNCMGATPVNSVVAPDVVYKFQRNKRYRLRILNSGALVLYYFSIDKHTLEIIEVEGMRVKDQYKNHTLLPLSVGQRYSVIASTDDNETSDFWMRIQTSLSCIRSTTPCDEKKMLVKEIRAIVHYGDESVDVPKTEPYVNVNNDTELKDKLPCIDFEYGLLSPADGSSAEESEDKLALPFGIYMTTINSTKNYIYTTYGSIALTSDSGLAVIFNESIFDYTQNTVQYTIENQDLFKEYGSQIYDPELNVIVLNNYGQLIDVIITNADDIAHPIHLHGHFFRVMAYQKSASGPIIEYSNNQIERDTVTVAPRSTVKIRFKTENYGVWAFHCHIEWHVEVGMMAQFVELPLELPNLEPSDETIFIDKIGQTVTLTPWRDLCQEPEYTNPTGDEDWKQYCNSFISNGTGACV